MDNHNEEEEVKKELTLDDLARMVQDGFAQTASKEALDALGTRLDERITGLDDCIIGLEKRMESQHQDIMRELRPMKETLKEHTTDIVDLQLRVRTIEKIGTGSKKKTKK